MSTLSTQDYWHDICIKAFNSDPKANDFVLFVEGCKTQQANNGVYTWVTSRQDYKDQLRQLDCQPLVDDDTTWTLPTETLSLFAETKRKARSDWHTHRQITLKNHLNETLTNINSPLNITNDQRLALVKEFARNHETDLGSVPFLRGLVGFLQYQLREKHYVAEWKMSEYVLTQNNEDGIESYVRLLKGVLGMQLLYQDDDQSDRIVIDIDNTNQQEETELTWRISPDFDNHLIQDILKYLPKEHNSTGYQISDIERIQSSHQNILQWIYEILSHCLSFLHK